MTHSPDNKTDVCCPKCLRSESEITHDYGVWICANPQCDCHQSPQTSHDLIENIISAYKITPPKEVERWLRKTLTDIVEKTREEGFKEGRKGRYEFGSESSKRGYLVGKAEGRAETLQEVHEKILSMPDERTTGIHRLTDAHVLVCWIQEQIKDIKKK